MRPEVRKLTFVIFFLSLFQSQSSGQSSLLDSVINKELLTQFVSHLASDSMQGRFTGTKENVLAAKFIAAELDKAGAVPLAGNEDFFASFLSSFNGFFIVANTNDGIVRGFNVVAALPGKSRPQEVIVICAHYDHVGTERTNPYRSIQNRATETGDTIYNGANDNASGVAAMLALAKYYGQLNNNERTILFIAFSGEELGLLGAREFIRTIKNPEDIKAVLNLEMLGRVASGGYGRPFITGHGFSDLRVLLNKELADRNRKKYGRKYFVSDLHTPENLFARSDNYPFALLGIPAHTIIAGSPNDPHYHSVQDEVKTLNFEMMVDIVRAVAIAANPLISGSATPRRINLKRLTGGRVF